MDLSILTTTYNRANTLPRLARSIDVAALPNLEWVVVDDGSTDGTPELMREFDRNLEIRGRYERCDINAGRYVAQNRAVELMRGRYALIMDSDDWFLPHVFDRFAAHIRWLDANSSVAGCVGLCEDQNGRTLGVPFPHSPLVSSFRSIADDHRVTGDKKELVRAEVLRSAFPFPVFVGEKRFAMSLIWRRIGRRHMCQFVNETWVAKEYRSDGLTANLVRIKAASPCASAYFYAEQLQKDHDASPRVRARWAMNYSRYQVHAWRAGRRCNAIVARAELFLLPVGFALAARDRLSISCAQLRSSIGHFVDSAAIKRRLLHALAYLRRWGPWQALRFLTAKVLRPQRLLRFLADGRHVWLRGGTSDLSAFAQVFGLREYSPIADVIRQLRNQPRVIVDLGANIGLTSLFLATEFPAARIIALEPEASNFEALKRNTRDIPAIEPVRAAIWSHDGEVEIVDSAPEKWSCAVRTGDGTGHTVRAISLPTLMRERDLSEIDFLKVDIEGAEKELFATGGDWIDQVHLVAAEMHDRKVDGCTAAATQLFSGAGLTVEQLGEHLVASRDRSRPYDGLQLAVAEAKETNGG